MTRTKADERGRTSLRSEEDCEEWRDIHLTENNKEEGRDYPLVRRRKAVRRAKVRNSIEASDYPLIRRPEAKRGERTLWPGEDQRKDEAQENKIAEYVGINL